MDVLDGIADLAPDEDEEPEDKEAEHQNRDHPERPEQALRDEDALEIQKLEIVVGREKDGDHDGSRQRRAPLDPGVGNGPVERRQDADQQRE